MCWTHELVHASAGALPCEARVALTVKGRVV